MRNIEAAARIRFLSLFASSRVSNMTALDRQARVPVRSHEGGCLVEGAYDNVPLRVSGGLNVYVARSPSVSALALSAGPPSFKSDQACSQFGRLAALARWYRTRTEGPSGARKTTMIVALARKLLIALWRLVTTGEVPDGVELRPAA
jgi:hypothetical protein